MAPQLEAYMQANEHKLGHPCKGFTDRFWEHVDEQAQLQSEAMNRLIELPTQTEILTPKISVSSQNHEPKQYLPPQPTKNNRNRTAGLAVMAMIIIAILSVAYIFAFYHPSTSTEANPSDIIEPPIETITIVIPTEDAVRQWLVSDVTNELLYQPKIFVCIDYAIMLATHAETMNWSMGIVLIYGKDTQQQWFNHSINSIYTTNGLVYIEPQTDELWHLPSYRQMQVGKTYTFFAYPYETSTVRIVEIDTIHLDDLDQYEFTRG